MLVKEEVVPDQGLVLVVVDLPQLRCFRNIRHVGLGVPHLGLNLRLQIVHPVETFLLPHAHPIPIFLAGEGDGDDHIFL